MRVTFLGAIVFCAVPFVYAAVAAPAEPFAVSWETDQLSVLRVPNADPPAAGNSLPGPPYTENFGSWLSDGTSGTTGCGNRDCISCLLCPNGYAYAESLFMTRTNGNAVQPILIDGLDASRTLLSTSDLHFNWTPGMRVGAGIRMTDRLFLDFSYLGLFDSDASATMIKPEGTLPKLPDPLGSNVNAFKDTLRAQADYTSQLNSFELNLLCGDCCFWTDGCADSPQARSVEWFGGFRFINLNERLRITGTTVLNNVPETGEYSLGTNNNLYGAQLGARVRRCYGRFGWEATGKAGIYGNEAYETQTIVDCPDEYVLRPTTTGRGTQVAFSGEINLSAIYQLTKTWNVRAGYNLLWIDGVALAPNQLDFTYNLPTTGSQLNTDGGVFYHGASIGLEARW